MQKIEIKQPGSPDALVLSDLTLPAPGQGELLIRQTAVGVNFIDIYHRTGVYKQPSYPAGIGLEGAGVVEEAGQGATLKAGDRVAYCGGPIGGYATHRIMAEQDVVKIPDGVSDEDAAALMLKGLTAQYLLRRTFPVKKGDVILIHAAAGGVGLIASAWAKHLGATVIGTVGSEEKARLAGCDHTIIYTKEDFVAKVKALTGGRGVDVVYDSVGQTTFLGSLDCLKPLGMMVSFGQSSGAIPPVDTSLFAQKGSLYFTRPTLMTHLADKHWYRAPAAELFDLVARGVVKATIGGRYKLEGAAMAHRDLESRRTSGALILLP